MEKHYLSLNQSVCAARIFLNTFGLILDDDDSLNEDSKINILDSENNIVGHVSFNDGKVLIEAEYNNCTLSASYDIPLLSGGIDWESKKALYGHWVNDIKYIFQQENGISLNGEFKLAASVDSEFGSNCTCHQKINCEVPDKGNISLEFFNNGYLFIADIKSNEYFESIEINTGVWYRHVINRGQKDSKGHYPYRKYAGIFRGAERGENVDKIHVFLAEDEYDKNIITTNGFLPKNGEDNSFELLEQKSTLMKNLDSEVFEKIRTLRDFLSIEDLSLLDNLISVSFKNYSKEELETIFGYEISKLKYQNGTEDLVDSYFANDEKNSFLSKEAQKRLLK